MINDNKNRYFILTSQTFITENFCIKPHFQNSILRYESVINKVISNGSINNATTVYLNHFSDM
ncbi:MAG: hypothetical protein CR982_00675 [Candidatus Cloacimonadota bacterium]|nr:MAG: hypothetical protein CR982_00675 [Candidatus Cloacimonadota bacterium]PIE78445.1 MAG: hypothetical protein CSA15_07850 [Candidatus Delongbacteria bacterium]